jgi:hypothetical protein
MKVLQQQFIVKGLIYSLNHQQESQFHCLLQQLNQREQKQKVTVIFLKFQHIRFYEEDINDIN